MHLACIVNAVVFIDKLNTVVKLLFSYIVLRRRSAERRYGPSFIPVIGGNIFHIAVQNIAEGIYGADRDSLIISQAMKQRFTDVIILYKIILGDSPFLHSLPKLVVLYHIYSICRDLLLASFQF